jgi:hypothetical protein
MDAVRIDDAIAWVGTTKTRICHPAARQSLSVKATADRQNRLG